MQQSRHFNFRAPALLPMYGKAILSRSSAKQNKPRAEAIPPIEATLTGVRTDTTGIRDYRRVCGFSVSNRCPIIWPHILAFPLHVRLLTDATFPLPLLGLVHLRNHIEQQRSIGQGEVLELSASLANATDTEKGIEFDIVTAAMATGREIWREHSTILYRQPAPDQQKKGPAAAPIMLQEQTSIQAPGNIGYRYGRVSGDMNPIHLHALSARAFGFPRNIAHGMWSKARCLATLEQTEPPLENVRVDAQFKTPFFLPGTAILTWARGATPTMPFRLLNKDASAPHLEGSIEWV